MSRGTKTNHNDVIATCTGVSSMDTQSLDASRLKISQDEPLIKLKISTNISIIH